MPERTLLSPLPIVLCLALIAPTAAQPLGVRVPDPSNALFTLPQAANAPAPGWIRPGTRLVYFGASATVAGVGKQLVLDDNGNWVEQATGRRFAERDVPSSGGMGYSIVEVGYLDRSTAALSAKLYPMELTTNKPYFAAGGGMVTNAGAAGDYWVNPAVLQQIQEMNQQGVSIRRMPYDLGGRRYNAIRFQTTTPNGYTAYTYDLDSGLMLFFGSRVEGQAVMTAPNVSGQTPGVGRGSTQLTTSYFVGTQQVDVPWANLAPPAGIERLTELQYQGTQSTSVQGAGQYEYPIAAIVTVRAGAPGWTRFTTAVRVDLRNGLPPVDNVTDGACGVASIGGIWIPPDAATVLRPGQEIARDPSTASIVVVSGVGGGLVTITETGPLHRLDYRYDLRSGLLADLSIQQQIGMGLMTTRLRLTGTR